MNSRTNLCLVAGLAFAGAAGCGAQSDMGENTATVRGALGSTWTTPVPIGSLQALKTMDMAGNYYLSKDIDGQNSAWVPLSGFTGTLDGRGRTIKNLSINDPNHRAGAFFEATQEAIIKNIRFTGINVTGNNIAAGVSGVDSGSSFDQVAFQGNVNGAIEAGGLVGRLFGGSITRSYMKGTVSGATSKIGGLVADCVGSVVGSYAQATVTGNTSGGSPTAGGIVGELSDGGDVHDVYAVGNVKGRGHVGGIIGNASCSPGYGYFMYNGIYRGGDLVDANRNGWSGAIGDFANCDNVGRLGLFWYDTTSDQSGTHNTDFVGNIGASSDALKTPVTAQGGVYCQWGAGHCADNGLFDPPWNPGTNQQQHTLRGVLDANSQPF
jgi:hypothetical protein